MQAERAVLIRYINSEGEPRRASGLRIGRTFVLTADHCASGSNHVVVVNGVERSATVHVRTNSEAIDIAVLKVPGAPELGSLRVGLVDRQELAHLDSVVAAGFPKWKRSPLTSTGTKQQYLLASVRGSVPTSENNSAYETPVAFLSLKITDPAVLHPVPDGSLDQETSVWGGFSGAGVVTDDDTLIGVIHSHTLSEGPQMLTVTPLDAINTLDQDTAEEIWTALGVDDPSLLPQLPARTPPQSVLSIGIDELVVEPRQFLDHIKSYCLTLPQWVPDRLSFRTIWQPLDLVSTPPPGAKTARRQPSLNVEVDQHPETQSGPTTTALNRTEGALAPTQFLVSGPGTGKSWYLRHLALEAAERYAASDVLRPLPILISARLLESALDDEPDAVHSNSSLIAALAKALPHGLAGRLHEAEVDRLKRHLETEAVLLLIDGYDEVSRAEAKLGELLPRICGLISANEGRVIVTSRPGALPNIWDIAVEWTSLRPLTLQQRVAFIQTWFSGDEDRSQFLSGWLRQNRFEALSSPLLLTLFSSDAEGRPVNVAPPSTEHDLWARALRFLTGQAHRDRPLAATSSTVRHRIHLLTALARLFVRESAIATELGIDEIRKSLSSSRAWSHLQETCRPIDPLEDLLQTGLVQHSENSSGSSVEFFHSACRDYLIASSLCQGDTWMDFVPRIWSQPEWEPVFRYLGAVHEAPNDVLQTLIWQFECDPFNAARFTAGSLVAAARERNIGSELKGLVVNELLIIVGSADPEDGQRAVRLLASIGGNEILQALTSLLNPSLRTPIIVRAIEALSTWPYNTATYALRSVVLSSDFTALEREAAIRSIASVGTELASELVRAFSINPELPARTRATSAVSALRLYDDPAGALAIFNGDSESDLASQRLLAERLATDSACFTTLRSVGGFDWRQVPDAYAVAVLGWVQSQVTGRSEFVSRVATSPGVARSLQMIADLYARAEGDFAYASFLHFVLEKPGQESARRLHGIWPHVEKGSTCEEAWSSYIQENIERPNQLGAQFLARLLRSGPLALRERIQVGVDTGQLPDLVGSFARAMPSSFPVGAPPKEKPGRVTRQADPITSDESKPLSIEEVLDGQRSSAEKYSILRVRQREVQAVSPLFVRLAHLTDKVSTKFASDWIDCIPSIAPALEVRLIQARWAHRSCQIELTNLRAHWPARWREAVNTSREPEPEILSAVAAAYFVAGEYDDARTAALACVGAATVRSVSVSRQTVIALAGSSALVGGFNEIVFPWVIDRSRTQGDVHARVAAAWCVLPWDPGSARRMCDELPRWAQAGSADYFALKYCLDGAWPENLGSLKSWFNVQRTERMLRAMLPRMQDQVTRANAEDAADGLAKTAVDLAKAWPTPRTDSPTEIGRERWHWAVTSRATSLLASGQHDEAAQLFLSLVEDSPHDPVLLNNYGFCMMALDAESAAVHLKKAAASHGYPWVVNIANRMLIHYRFGRYDDALRLGRQYAEGGGRLSGGTATLWNIDNPNALVESADPEGYLFEIARRCLRHTSDNDMRRFWLRFMRSHSMAGAGSRDIQT